MRITNRIKITAVVALMALLSSFAVQAANPIYVDSKNRLAIEGYDPVAYFNENQAVAGSRDYSAQWKGATWHFSSAENRDKFLGAPEQFAPQYGGYCAYALSRNKLYKIEPDQFTIIDGKLYLNFNEKTKNKWLKDPSKYIAKADKNWPAILE